MTGEFNPTYSTNNIWVDEEFDYCLTLLLEAIQASIAAKADATHTHSGYALSSHTHNYSPLTHAHSEYSTVGHNHDNAYSLINHSHTASAVGAVATSDIATLTEVRTYLGI